jgi:hypothetical protein
MTLVIGADSKKHYEDTITFAKRIGLYEPIVPDPKVDQIWYMTHTPWWKVVVTRVDLSSSIAELKVGKGFEDLRPEPYFLTFEEVKKNFRPEDYEPGDLSRYLKNCLDYLDSYAEGEGTERQHGRTSCFLYPDGKVFPLDDPEFCPNFYFRMFRNLSVEEQKKAQASGGLGEPQVFWFNGGLLFYRKGDSGVGGPNYSVRMDSSDSGWSINT